MQRVTDGDWPLILLSESLNVRFAGRIEEFLTALLPRRFEFWRCDVPIRPAFLGDGTEVQPDIFHDMANVEPGMPPSARIAMGFDRGDGRRRRRCIGLRRIFPLLLILSLTGCGYQDRALRIAQLNATIGQNEVGLVRQFGVPTRTYKADGRKFLAYEARNVDIIPGTPVFGGWYYGNRFPPQVITRVCDTTFELAGDNIVSWTQRGNAC